jgi:hypothetical protein
MFGFFGRKTGIQKYDLSKWKEGALDSATFRELLAALQARPPSVAANTMVDLTKRIIEIVYQDGSLAEEERDQARRLADAIIQDTEMAFAGNEKGLNAYRVAYQEQLRSMRQFGIGSLIIRF